MINPEDVDADQLAQARGCEPWNDCYGECLDVADRHLKEDRPAALEGLMDWINSQAWS